MDIGLLLQPKSPPHLIFTFLSFAINLSGILNGEPLIAGIMAIMTISPTPHDGHKYGSLPVDILINSLVVSFTFGIGGGAPRLALAFVKSCCLVLEQRKPIYLIFTKPFGRICSAKSRKNVSHYDCFGF